MTLRFLLIPALALSACTASAPPAKPPLEGARIGGAFTLTDQNGKTVTEQAFAGKYRIMYFGYTFCPDVCPTDVQAIGAAVKKLEASDPALAAKIVPVFVTVDPARDTPAVLKQFVSAFHPRMVGLTGTDAQIARIKTEYAVYSSKGDASPGGGYLVNHSRQAYLMDPDGKPLALLPQEQGPDAVVTEIKRWAR
ncbi:SCO family protein [Sphingomonas sp. CFBP 13603]|uniref:SCO family protein n=1 Tax=Sphingomonas sp. CFBP 13603 TaxID=2774040 RepID=UPI0018667673|nr:SCO family protein [Sphingomonas sp. CFBP 13603]MBE2993433.1 SCO family protein [Sphingomonas sp. CFBP 13603]